MTKTAIVIGAGITGVSAALWLRRAGVDVTLIDRILPGDPEQTSYGNAGLLARAAIVPVSEPGILTKAPRMLLDPESPLFLKWHYLPRLLPWLVPFLRNSAPGKFEPIVRALAGLTSDSVDQHIALAKGTEAAKFIQQGDYTFYYQSRKYFEKDALGMSLRRDAGMTPFELNRAEMLERDPNVSARYNFAAMFPDHGWLTSPSRYVQALADAFQKLGGRFEQAEIAELADGAVTLKGGGGVRKADKIVLAAGAWSATLAKQVGQKAMLETERGYHLFLNGASFMPPNPLMITDAKFAVTPMEGGLRCAGIVELGGLRAKPSKAPLELLRKRIRQVYPNIKWQSEDTWMGHRPSTPDSVPHIGPLKDAPNVIAAFGAQHIGVTVGPKVGRLVADMVTGRTPNMDLAPYAPNRFQS